MRKKPPGRPKLKPTRSGDVVRPKKSRKSNSISKYDAYTMLRSLQKKGSKKLKW